MGTNTAIKVVFKAYDQRHELIFPNSYMVCDLANYLRTICNTYVIIDMQPTSKEPNI